MFLVLKMLLQDHLKKTSKLNQYLKLLVDLIKMDSKKTEVLTSFLIGAGFSIIITLAFGATLPGELINFFGMIHSVLVAPVFEELLFRGLLLGYLIFWIERQYENRETSKYFFLTLSVLFSAFIFMLCHGPNWSLFVSGIIYGCLYVWRRSVFLPMVAHFGYNLTMWSYFILHL